MRPYGYLGGRTDRNRDLKSPDNSKSHVPGPVGPRHNHMAYIPRDTHEMMMMIMMMMMMMMMMKRSC